jgi:outer membrane protein assembly factor BamB
MAAGLPRRAVRKRTLCGALLGALVGLGGSGGTGLAEDPPLSEALPISAPITDPSGRLEGLLREARDALEAQDMDRVVDLLAAAHLEGPEVLVGIWPGIRDWPDLREPAGRSIELLACSLPAPQLAQLSLRVHGGAIALAQARACTGDLAALERLVQAPILDAVGRDALLVLAELAMERGDPARAVDHLRRWEGLSGLQRPLDDLERVERVRGRLVVAAALLGDDAELDMRSRPEEPGSPQPDPDPLPPSWAAARAARKALAEARLRAPVPPESTAPLPAHLRRLWQRDLTDPDLRGTPDVRPDLVTAALVADEEMVLLHDGRRVRRLDPLSGRERWAFPPGPLGWEHDPVAKYEPHDLPVRCVERHGDLVLAVLGDPGGTGAFAQGDLQLDIDTGTRESRSRLVALDAATGSLRWHTGTLRESHPVLGDRATCCASPPLVVGEDVYVLFARRVGVAEVYAACLERATGRPRWVRFLAASESGRDPGVAAQGGRDARARVRAVPWGQRPALAEGELCVVPHAGFAAGVDPRHGEVLWLRALPRFRQSELPNARRVGASARNVPLAVGGAWVLAPMDTPGLVALERGTGRLRWTGPVLAGQEAGWRDLLGLAQGDAARPVVRVVGTAPCLLDAHQGALLAAGASLALDDPDGATMGGRALDLGVAAALLDGGKVIVRPWPGHAEPAASGVIELKTEPSAYDDLDDAPGWGDLVRSGEVWFAIEPGRVSAWVEGPRAVPLLEAATAEAPGDTALEASAGLLLGDPERLARAFAALEGDPGGRASAGLSLATLLESTREGPELAELAWSLRESVPTLPGAARERIYRAGADRLWRAERWDDLVAWLGHWIDAAPVLAEHDWLASPSPTTPTFAPPLRLRGDLYAARELRALRLVPPAADALARREGEVAARITSALASDDPARVREVLRTSAGTRALSTLRRALAERAAAAGDAARAARLAADLRLDAAEPSAGREPEARLEAARWQLAEAGWLVEAGDVEGARTLLEDLRRWVPSGVTDAKGRTTTALFDTLRATYGWALHRGPDVRAELRFWPGDAGKLDHDRRGSIRVPSLRGPGAGRSTDRFLLCRGLGLEVWSLASGERVASMPSGDEGWFGGTLQDATPWLPERGVRIVTTVAGEPADQAGFRSGDWLLTWDGVPVTGLANLMRRIAVSRPGLPIEVTRVRDGVASVELITPGRRPAEEARDVLERPTAWVDAQGRHLVPTRVGVLRVDLETATATPLWSHTGPGTVQSLDVVGGQALLAIRRLHDDDLLVAVDPHDGRELWRVDVPGPIASVEASGSALVVGLGLPARALLLDAQDGTARGELELVEPMRPERRAVLTERTTSGSQAGRLYALVPDAEQAGIAIVNTTTLAAPIVRVESGRRGQRFSFEPQLSVGAYVGLLQGPSQISVLEPDPLGDRVLRSATLHAGDLLTEQLHHGGELDHESRIVLAGETLYVVRYQPRYPGSPQRGVTVMTFGRIDDSKGRLRWSMLDHEPPASRVSGELFLTHLDAHPDGLLVSTVARNPDADGAFHRSVLWVPSAEGGSSERSGSPPVWVDGPVVPRRAGPARVGGAFLLLTDDGARALPLGAP